MDPSSVAGSLYTRLAKDIVTNAMELAPDVSWEEVLSARNTYWGKGRSTYEGRSAVEVSVARSLRPVAEQMGWGMDTPVAVYMSGLYFCRVLERSMRNQSKRVKEAKKGKRKFISDEARVATIASEEGEIGNLGGFKGKIEIALAKFARQKLPCEKSYLETIQKVLGLLWDGKPEEAVAMLSAITPKKAPSKSELLALPQPQAS